MNKQPMRIQFLRGNILQAEAIVESFGDARTLSYSYASLKLSRGSSAGDTFIYRADMPRLVKCRVGEKIN